MSFPGLRLAAGFALGSALAVLGCSALTPNMIVNGWSVGDVKACEEPRCAAQIPVAQAALEQYRPDHAPLVKLTIHEEGGYPRGDGTVAVPFRSGGCCDVALFQLSDGSVYAVGVGYPGVSEEPTAVERGPALDDPSQTPLGAE
jgi:hypothetical protein